MISILEEYFIRIRILPDPYRATSVLFFGSLTVRYCGNHS